MIADLKPYDDLKDSGLPWLGTIPSHWEVKRAKSVLHAIDVRSKSGTEELLTVSSANGVVPRSSTSVTMFKAKSYIGYKLCWPGDLAINSLWAWGGGLGVSKHHGIISTAYGVYRVRRDAEYDPNYLHSLVRSKPFNWELKLRSKGIWISRLQLTDESFLNAPIPVFPTDEQALIVRFLDWASVRLGKAIAAKRKVIGLLEEQKQAIIHHAVTRGLDDTVPLKPSGLDWLGDVPEHWDVTRVKFAAKKISKGDTPSNFGRTFAENGPVRFIKIENIGPGYILESPLSTIDLTTHSMLRRSHLQENDLVYAISGATTGKCAIVQQKHLPANTNQAVSFIRPNQLVDPQFLLRWLHGEGLKREMWLTTVTSAQPNLSMESLGNLPLLIPPKTEQAAIAETIDFQIQPFGTAQDRQWREINLLQEYRTRLISDVVTGKLDVREFAKSLPEDVSEEAAELAATETLDEDFATDDELIEEAV